MKITRKDVLFLSISSFVVTAVWIGSNLYHNWATSTISEDLQLQIIPINPNFDTAVIDKLKLREKVNPLSEIQLSVKEAPVSPTPVFPIQRSSSNSSSISGGIKGQ